MPDLTTCSAGASCVHEPCGQPASAWFRWLKPSGGPSPRPDVFASCEEHAKFQDGMIEEYLREGYDVCLERIACPEKTEGDWITLH